MRIAEGRAGIAVFGAGNTGTLQCGDALAHRVALRPFLHGLHHGAPVRGSRRQRVESRVIGEFALPGDFAQAGEIARRYRGNQDVAVSCTNRPIGRARHFSGKLCFLEFVDDAAPAADGTPRALLTFGILVDTGPGIVRSFYDAVGQIVFEADRVPGGGNQLFQIAHLAAFQLDAVTLGVVHGGGRALSIALCLVCLGEVELAAIAEGQGPAVSVPRVLRSVKLGRSVAVAENRIGKTGSFGDAGHVHLVKIFEVQVLIGVRKSGSSRADIVGMIATDAKRAAVIVPDNVSASEPEWHNIGNE